MKRLYPNRHYRCGRVPDGAGNDDSQRERLGRTPTGFHSPTPLVDDISPTAARLGGGGFILTLRGAGFRPGAEIGWQVGATTRRLDAFVCSPSEIVTWIPYSLVAKAATATVTVINPDAPPLVGKSNPVFLPITIPTAGAGFHREEHNPGRSSEFHRHRGL